MGETTFNANDWRVRATACELLAMAFRVPDGELAGAVASGGFRDAAQEIAGALGLALPDGWADGLAAPLAAERLDCAAGGATAPADAGALLHALRAEHTRLFVGAPDPAVSPYEGVWRAGDDGVQALLFVNPHSMDVERFCRSCGLGRPEGTNEPLDSAPTELELLEYLALRAARAAEGEAPAPAVAVPAVAGADLPGGSPAAAYGAFLADHALAWLPRFADAVARESRLPFYRGAAELLAAFLS